MTLKEHQDEHRRARDAYYRAFRFAAERAAPAIRDLTAVLKRMRGAEHPK